MKQRDVITLIGSAAAAVWRFAVRAQQCGHGEAVRSN
jgi:hypothetical protein